MTYRPYPDAVKSRRQFERQAAAAALPRPTPTTLAFARLTGRAMRAVQPGAEMASAGARAALAAMPTAAAFARAMRPA